MVEGGTKRRTPLQTADECDFRAPNLTCYSVVRRGRLHYSSIQQDGGACYIYKQYVFTYNILVQVANMMSGVDLEITHSDAELVRPIRRILMKLD